MDPISIGLAAAAAAGTIGGTAIAGMGFAHTLRKDSREKRKLQAQSQVHFKALSLIYSI
jgi:hypothetical protein